MINNYYTTNKESMNSENRLKSLKTMIKKKSAKDTAIPPDIGEGEEGRRKGRD